ncbi:MAG: hypothetical protein MJ149_00670 [Clostridia bacterium]|nr:hypothetical protein [Clostridia bacterium]
MKNNNVKKSKNNMWPLIILLISVLLSFGFGLLSEFLLADTVIAVAVVVIVVFVAVAILFDMIGLAVASSSEENFNAMAARKVKGSKQALALVKNAAKVSSICNDVIGDVCGVLSGAAGAGIVAKIVIDGPSFLNILIPSLVAALIAGLTIFGKAMFKRIAIEHADAITLNFAKFLNFFTRKG